MGSALSALLPATQTTVDRPELSLIAAVLTVVSLFLVGMSMFIPIMGIVISVLVAPFIAVTMTGLSYAAYENRGVSLDEFQTVLDAYFVDVTLAYLLIQAILFAVTFVMMIIGAVLLVPAVILGTPETATSGLGLVFGAVFVLLGAVYTLLYLFGAILLQLVDVSVIMDGRNDAIEALKHTVELLRENWVSITGYVTLRSVIWMVSIAVPVTLVTAGVIVQATTVSVGLVVIGVILGLFLIPVSIAYQFAYHVAYYDRLTSVNDNAMSQDSS